MAREIPEAVRAVAGLAVTVLDEARKLPETLPGLPVRLVGAAMQTSLKLQQQYAGLVARGDELLTGLQGQGGDQGLATFDDDEQPSAGPATGSAARDSAFDRVSEADLDDGLDDDLAGDDLEVGLDVVAAEAAVDTGTLPAGLTVVDDAEDGGGADAALVVGLPADPAADLVTAVVDELAEEVADEVAEELPEAVPDEVAEELTADAVADAADAEVDEETAIEEAVAEDLVADAVVTDEELTADLVEALTGDPGSGTGTDGGTNVAEAAATAAGVVPLDDLTPDAAPADTATLDDAQPPVQALAEAGDELTDLGGPDAAEDAAATADETPAPAGADSGTTADGGPDTTGAPAAAEEAGGAETAGAEAAGTAPIEGYDSFSIPALRGHLRAYPAETVADLLDYERATRSRQPYVTLLQNRLEKLNADRG